jgi:hypothetical protein
MLFLLLLSPALSSPAFPLIALSSLSLSLSLIPLNRKKNHSTSTSKAEKMSKAADAKLSSLMARLGIKETDLVFSHNKFVFGCFSTCLRLLLSYLLLSFSRRTTKK